MTRVPINRTYCHPFDGRFECLQLSPMFIYWNPLPSHPPGTRDLCPRSLCRCRCPDPRVWPKPSPTVMRSRARSSLVSRCEPLPALRRDAALRLDRPRPQQHLQCASPVGLERRRYQHDMRPSRASAVSTARESQIIAHRHAKPPHRPISRDDGRLGAALLSISTGPFGMSTSNRWIFLQLARTSPSSPRGRVL